MDSIRERVTTKQKRSNTKMSQDNINHINNRPKNPSKSSHNQNYLPNITNTISAYHPSISDICQKRLQSSSKSNMDFSSSEEESSSRQNSSSNKTHKRRYVGQINRLVLMLIVLILQIFTVKAGEEESHFARILQGK